MKMILTESQYKKLILENLGRETINKLKSLQEFFDNVSSESKKQIGLDLGFLATWGVTIAGFVRPISEFMKGEFPELTGTEITLLSTGIILTYFTSNKDKLSKVLDLIKEKNLIFEFDVVLEKADKLKNVFFAFIDSLAIPISKMSNMLAYTFIIPIIPELYEMAQGNESMDVSEMIGRVLGFVGITYGGNLTKRLLNEIVRRFKS
jgi:hypothetical protein